MDAAQARHSAFEIVKTIEAARPDVQAAPSPDGLGLGQALYLAMRLAGDGPGIVPGPTPDGSSIRAALETYSVGVEPERLPSGKGLAHAKFMAHELAGGMSFNKSLRWLGYLEIMAGYEGVAPVPPEGQGDPMSEPAVMLALGRIQGAMVYEGVTSLMSEKSRNLASTQAVSES